MHQHLIVAGSVFGTTGVVLGAWGAHGLATFLGTSVPGSWDTAVTYQLFHALALLFVGIWNPPAPWSTVLGVCFAFGIVFFSGSIYALVLGAPSWVGPVTPLGGLLFIVGWLLLIPTAYKSPRG